MTRTRAILTLAILGFAFVPATGALPGKTNGLSKREECQRTYDAAVAAQISEQRLVGEIAVTPADLRVGKLRKILGGPGDTLSGAEEDTGSNSVYLRWFKGPKSDSLHSDPGENKEVNLCVEWDRLPTRRFVNYYAVTAEVFVDGGRAERLADSDPLYRLNVTGHFTGTAMGIHLGDGMANAVTTAKSGGWRVVDTGNLTASLKQGDWYMTIYAVGGVVESINLQSTRVTTS